jgi:acyl dehydratase
MALLTFDDLAPGQEYTAGPITVTREAMIAFARDYDPQPFHLDEAAARDTFVGTLIGSGWQTAAFGMRLLAEALISRSTSMGSPGIDALRWIRPVLPGDQLSAVVCVEEVRASASKPDRGIARLSMTLTNATGDPVMTQAFAVMFARAGAVPQPRAVAMDAGVTRLPEAEEARDFPYLAEAEIGDVRDLGSHHRICEGVRPAGLSPRSRGRPRHAFRWSLCVRLADSGRMDEAVARDFRPRCRLHRPLRSGAATRSIAGLQGYALAAPGLRRRHHFLCLPIDRPARFRITTRLGHRHTPQHSKESARRAGLRIHRIGVLAVGTASLKAAGRLRVDRRVRRIRPVKFCQMRATRQNDRTGSTAPDT